MNFLHIKTLPYGVDYFYASNSVFRKKEKRTSNLPTNDLLSEKNFADALILR